MIINVNKAFRKAISNQLNSNTIYRVVAEAEYGKLAFEIFEKHLPHIVLMEIEMSILNSMEAQTI